MIKVAQGPPIGKSTKINVALQRPSVNVKEAENQGEQAAAAAGRLTEDPLTITKMGKSFASPSHGHLSQLFGDAKD
jgi:hypothetical protein